jgi:hypothetical protein
MRKCSGTKCVFHVNFVEYWIFIPLKIKNHIIVKERKITENFILKGSIRFHEMENLHGEKASN